MTKNTNCFSSDQEAGTGKRIGLESATNRLRALAISRGSSSQASMRIFTCSRTDPGILRMRVLSLADILSSECKSVSRPLCLASQWVTLENYSRSGVIPGSISI